MIGDALKHAHFTAAAYTFGAGKWRIDTSAAKAGEVHLLADGGHIRVDGQITANSTGRDPQNQPQPGGDIYIGRDKDTNVLAALGDVSGAQLQLVGAKNSLIMNAALGGEARQNLASNVGEVEINAMSIQAVVAANSAIINKAGYRSLAVQNVSTNTSCSTCD